MDKATIVGNVDISQKYVKMCEKAKEIQKEWEPEPGDWAESLRDGIVPLDVFILSLAESTPGGQKGMRIKADMTWLPRQDQLQEMLADKHCLHDLFYYFYGDFVAYHAGCHPHDSEMEEPTFTTAEQLWLAFVMHEKYQKQWSEEKGAWINYEPTAEEIECVGPIPDLPDYTSHTPQHIDPNAKDDDGFIRQKKIYQDLVEKVRARLKKRDQIIVKSSESGFVYLERLENNSVLT